MRARIVQTIVSIAIILVSTLTPLGADVARVARSRTGAPVVMFRDIGFHGTALADNADNSDGGDNNDGDNSNADNADNSSGGDNSDSNSDNSNSDNSDNSNGGDNTDNSDSDNSDSADNSNSDNGDSADNSDSDNGDSADNSDSNDAADNGGGDEALDNVSAPAPSAAAPAPAAPASTSPSAAGSETQASGTSTGGDSTIALAGDRVVVQVFPWMPTGVTITIRLVDPATAPPPPGTRAGNLLFRVEAQDASGAPLTTLPAEVHLGVRYADQDVAGLNKQNATLVWLDPADTQWKPGTKLATDPSTNYLAASVTALGTYAVSVP